MVDHIQVTLGAGWDWVGVSWGAEEKRLSSSPAKPNPELSPKAAVLCVCMCAWGGGGGHTFQVFGHSIYNEIVP